MPGAPWGRRGPDTTPTGAQHSARACFAHRWEPVRTSGGPYPFRSPLGACPDVIRPSPASFPQFTRGARGSRDPRHGHGELKATAGPPPAAPPPIASAVQAHSPPDRDPRRADGPAAAATPPASHPPRPGGSSPEHGRSRRPPARTGGCRVTGPDVHRGRRQVRRATHHARSSRIERTDASFSWCFLHEASRSPRDSGRIRPEFIIREFLGNLSTRTHAPWVSGSSVHAARTRDPLLTT